MRALPDDEDEDDKRDLLPEEAEADGMMDPRAALQLVRNVTRGIKYDDTANNIIAEVKQLADKTSGVDKSMLEVAEYDVFEAMRALESAVYNLDQVFEDAARQAEYDEEDDDDELTKEEYDNTPNKATDVMDIDMDELAYQPNKGDHRERQAGLARAMPTEEVKETYEKLMKEYKDFQKKN